MNNIISQMLAGYETKNVNDEINALKEIIQEVVLCGLSRSDFFDKVAFYGGTALRIFYNIDREYKALFVFKYFIRRCYL